MILRPNVLRGTAVALIALALGVLTDFGQSWLPQSGASAANSGGLWILIAFALALWATRSVLAVLWGMIGLTGLVVGYYVASGIRAVPESLPEVLFWIVASLVIGPLVGVAAGWVRRGSKTHVGMGSGFVSGILVGESIFGLTKNAASTSAGYWWVQIAVAIALLFAIILWRARNLRAVIASLCIGTIAAALTYVAYFHPVSVRH